MICSCCSWRPVRHLTCCSDPRENVFTIRHEVIDVDDSYDSQDSHENLNLQSLVFGYFWQHFSEKTKSNQASSAREGRACSALATAWSTVATSFNTSSTWHTGKLWETPSLLGKCCRPWCQAELANWHEPDPCHDRLPKGNRDKRKHRHRWSHRCTFHSVPCRALVVGPSDAYQK